MALHTANKQQPFRCSGKKDGCGFGPRGDGGMERKVGKVGEECAQDQRAHKGEKERGKGKKWGRAKE